LSSNNKVRYVVTKSEYDILYSVECICDNVVVCAVRNVSSDRAKAEMFCRFLNENHVSPVHFYDVFEEYFYG